MRIPKVIVTFCFLLLAATSATAQDVNVDYDRGSDFAKYKTYAWGTGTPASNPMTHQRIVAGIEAQLAAKGLRKVDSNPDILVIYNATSDTRVSINTWGGGPFGAWRFGSGRATVEKTPVGQLTVDIGDVSAKKFVWRGAAAATISSKHEKNDKTLNAALTKMFENFPLPPGKKK
jgi:Domain of unknown function (DUF4136)